MSPTQKWSAIPAQRSSAPVLRVKLALVLGTLLVAALMGPLALVISLGHSHSSAPAPAPQGGASGASAVAQIAATEFVSGVAYTIPIASGLDQAHGIGATSSGSSASSSSATPVPLANYTGMAWSGETDKSIDQVTYKLETYIVATTSATYQLTVAVTQRSGGWVLGAQPGLEPYVGASTGSSPRLDFSNDPGATQNYPSGLTSQVTAWASAYASGNQAELAILANRSGTYAALSGFSVVGTPTILTVVKSGTEDYVQVSVLLSQGGAQKYQAETEFDLLVQPGAGIPKIVAWGPAGDVPLVPYANLIG